MVIYDVMTLLIKGYSPCCPLLNVQLRREFSLLLYRPLNPEMLFKALLEELEEMRGLLRAQGESRVEVINTPVNLFEELNADSKVQKYWMSCLFDDETPTAASEASRPASDSENTSLKEELEAAGSFLCQGDTGNGESLAGESVVTIVVKDGVQTGPPSVHIVETVSIATQTDKVAILAAAVQTNGFLDKFCDLPSESDSSDSSGSYAGFEVESASPPEDIYREVATEATLSDADESSDSGCKVLSLESVPDICSEVASSSQPSKEFHLPNVLEALKSLSEEEVESRAQQLALALQTDGQTLMQRLELRLRHRELAEKNLEREIDRMRNAMQSLQYLCTDCHSLDILTEVRTQLDCVLASALSVSATAEAYGFVQSEERMAAAIAPLVNYVDTLVNIRMERPLHSPSRTFSSLDDDRFMRRRSVAAVPLSLESRRRASIPFFPRPSSPLSKNGVPPGQPPSPGFDFNSRRDSNLRQRREARLPEVQQMAEITETPESMCRPVSQLATCVDSETDDCLDSPTEIRCGLYSFCKFFCSSVLPLAILAAFLWSSIKIETREKPV